MTLDGAYLNLEKGVCVRFVGVPDSLEWQHFYITRQPGHRTYIVHVKFKFKFSGSICFRVNRQNL